MANQDNKQRNLLIGIGAIVAIVLIAAGLITWAISSNKSEPAGTTNPYQTVTPGLGDATQQPGSVSIEPQQIQLARGPDGKLAGQATVSALFQDLRIDNITFKGDPNLQSKSDCPQGSALKAGQRCQITITYNENGIAPTGATTGPPTINIVGKSKTPGGQDLTVEASATVGGSSTNGQQGANGTVNPNAIAGANGPLGSATPNGTSVAPSGVAPYGQPSTSTTPPVDYSQPAVPAKQPTLSPREQFMLARRQAVLGGIQVRNTATGQPVSNGSWDEIGVPKAVSSAQQDMSRVVTMDRIITAVLSRPFDSRATQQVVAQVDRNVYGATGRNILIPRGSTIIGTAVAGPERVAISWTQIIRPDGARFIMKGTGGDAMGQADVPGYVNNRYLKRIGQVLLGTVVKAGTAYATNATQPQGDGLGGSAGQNNGAIITGIISTDVNNIINTILKQDIKPIVTVPAGTRLTIVPQQDLVMRAIDRPTIVRPAYPRLMNGGAPAPDFQPQVAPQGGQQMQGYGTSNPGAAYSGGAQGGQGSTYQPQNPNPTPPPLNQRAPATSLGATPPWSNN